MLFGHFSWVHMSGNNALLNNIEEEFPELSKEYWKINGQFKKLAIDSL